MARNKPEPPESVDAASDEQQDLSDKYVERALKLSGYEQSDIAAFNPITLVFVTYNGGKYRISKNGRRLEHLSGPTPPVSRE